MLKAAIGENGRRYRTGRRRTAGMRVRAYPASVLRLDLDEIAVWPRDSAEDDLTYTSAIGRAGPRRDCPCGYGTAVHARYCLDCDRAGLDGPFGYRPPPGRPGRWHPNDYPGIAPDLASNPDFVGEDRPAYEPPPPVLHTKVSRKARRAASRAG